MERNQSPSSPCASRPTSPPSPATRKGRSSPADSAARVQVSRLWTFRRGLASRRSRLALIETDEGETLSFAERAFALAPCSFSPLARAADAATSHVAAPAIVPSTTGYAAAGGKCSRSGRGVGAGGLDYFRAVGSAALTAFRTSCRPWFAPGQWAWHGQVGPLCAERPRSRRARPRSSSVTASTRCGFATARQSRPAL